MKERKRMSIQFINIVLFLARLFLSLRCEGIGYSRAVLMARDGRGPTDIGRQKLPPTRPDAVRRQCRASVLVRV